MIFLKLLGLPLLLVTPVFAEDCELRLLASYEVLAGGDEFTPVDLSDLIMIPNPEKPQDVEHDFSIAQASYLAAIYVINRYPRDPMSISYLREVASMPALIAEFYHQLPMEEQLRALWTIDRVFRENVDRIAASGTLEALDLRQSIDLLISVAIPLPAGSAYARERIHVADSAFETIKKLRFLYDRKEFRSRLGRHLGFKLKEIKDRTKGFPFDERRALARHAQLKEVFGF